MKYPTYVITFAAYVAVHILRMGYSSIKPQFQIAFGLDSIFLGLFDGLVYISLGLGFFLRFFIEGSTAKTTIYLIFGIITACSYAVIPLLGLFLEQQDGTIGDQPFEIRYLIPGISLIIFGFCQFTAWPVLLYLVSQHFNIQKEGTILGIWSANGDVGNVLGFLLGYLIMQQLDLKWHYVMLIGAGVHFLMAILVFITLKDKKRTTKQSEQLLSVATKSLNQEKTTRKDNFRAFLRYAKQVIALHENKMYLLAMAFLKSILYGFLLWMPTYLTHQNYKDYSTWAPSLFNVSTVFGSALLGYFYKQKRRVPLSEYNSLTTGGKCMVMLNKNIKSYSLFYSCLIICGCLIVFFVATFNIILTMVFSGIIGFFLGGAFNMLASNQVMAITHGDDSKVDMLSTLSMAIGNIIVGIVEIIIGLALNVKKDYSKESNLFIVLLSISSCAGLIILVRSTMIYRRRRQFSIIQEKGITDSQF